MNHETAHDIAQTLQCALYTERSQHPLVNAQENLGGRTYYVDATTLRFHKARILTARPVASGAFFLIVESCALDYNNTRRGFRAVLFDLLGSTVYRPDLEQCRRTREKASADFWDWFDEFNEIEHYRAEMRRRAEQMERQIEALKAAAERITEGAAA